MTPQTIGVDGWPLDGSDERQRHAEFLARRAEDIAHRLHVHEQAWQAGSLPAVMDALVLCFKEKRELPPWLARVVWATLEQSFKPSDQKGQKRIAALMKRERRKHIDYMRWDAVREIRDRKEELLNIARSLDPDDDNSPLSNFEPTWDVVYDYAAKILRGTIAEGGSEAIKRSYQIVQKAFKDGRVGDVYAAEFGSPRAESRVTN